MFANTFIKKVLQIPNYKILLKRNLIFFFGMTGLHKEIVSSFFMILI